MRTLEEIERHAFVTGDDHTVALIRQGEEEFALEITFDHQLVIDDRNRLRDALEALLAAMEGVTDEFGAEVEQAVLAMRQVEEQGEVTLRELCDRLEEANQGLRSTNADLTEENLELRRIKSMCKHLLRAFIGKHHPAWAEALRKSLKENT